MFAYLTIDEDVHPSGVQFGKPPIDGNFLVDMMVRAAERLLENQQPGRWREIMSFFASLNWTMY